MDANVKFFMNCIKNFVGICKNKTKQNKYDYQTLNTKCIIDMEEQKWCINVKYMRLSTLHFMGIGILYIFTYLYNFNLVKCLSITVKTL